MAARTIETKAIISAEDKTGNAFAAVVQKMARMESAAKTARVHLGSVDRAAAETRRAELAHHREVAKVQREIQHHGAAKYAAEAAATAVAAHSIVDVIKDSLKAGAGYQHEVTALQNAGRNAKEMEEITKAARDAVALIPTSTYTENMKVINETTSAFGSLHHAIENLPFMQKSASVLQAASPEGSHVDAAELGNKMARAFEERGTAGNSELFRKEASEVMRAMAFSGGKFNPNELLAFAQQAKSSLQNYDLQFLSRIAPSIIGTQGGDRAGTAANAFTSVIMGKANDAKQAEEWAKYGLLDTKQAIMKKGKITSWRAGAVTNTELALSNPLEWAEKVALPAMKAKGVNVDDRMALTKVLGTMFRNQNSNMFANEIMQVQQRSRLHKDEGLINQAGSLDDIYSRNLKQDPTVAIKAMTAAFDNLITTVSAPAMATVASGLTTFANGMQAVSNVLKDHPVMAMMAGGTAATGALAGSGYAAYTLANGFGLSTSAAALDGSAVALDAAAAKLGGAGMLSAGEKTAEHYLAGGSLAELGKTGGKAAGLFGMGALGSAGLLGGALLAFDGAVMYGAKAYQDSHPDEFHSHAWAAYHRYDPHKYGFHMTPTRRGDNGHLVSDVGTNDFTLGSSGGFSKAPAAGGSIGSLTKLSPDVLRKAGGLTDEAHKTPPQMVRVTFDQIPPIKGEFTVTASSQLLQVETAMKTATVQLKAKADIGPGGLGETHTGQ